MGGGKDWDSCFLSKPVMGRPNSGDKKDNHDKDNTQTTLGAAALTTPAAAASWCQDL